MATAYYTQPAAANYFQPASHSSHPPRQRGFRVCDNCSRPESGSVKLRLCGACLVTQYCSANCQRDHRPAHKAVCQHTAKQLAASSAQGDENTARNLRKFVSAHQDLLNWAGFQALRLKRVPANVRHQALLIELDSEDHTDPIRRFSVKGTHIVERTYITGSDPLVAEDIHRRDERCRQMGGMGCAVVLIQCGSISQVMPVEVDSPHNITWDSREDWATTLSHFVSSGRTDFKPISTSSRGTYYG